MNVKAARASATRESILVTAERLFAEHGVQVVSNRHISEAAGQGNNAAVNYHFGTKVDLVRAIVRRHSERMERLRAELVEAIEDDGDLRDWVACLVRPSTTYLRELGAPTWFARFSAQVMTDPALREIIAEESLASPALARAVAGLNRCLDGLPADVRAERSDMARQLMIHMTAERERALAEGTPTPRATWDDAGTGLIDAITGLLLAPVTPA
ncbi:TetR family transcriptional regulator [Amycolatopsis mongoliensis]|uniref:TetR family transcriptional regulator n=1 Tax=Amycolatopsis mongoliensis TaxID=715475 RepID=A0A9Y2JNG7_9PSEU|nr:TetR/AcrR family transcriptional regulator [Amycolatopsis sp. 4-36]WIY00549.1 TetR family transcriptional regulator [Amycolatopsis sp. 4-36]